MGTMDLTSDSFRCCWRNMAASSRPDRAISSTTTTTTTNGCRTLTRGRNKDSHLNHMEPDQMNLFERCSGAGRGVIRSIGRKSSPYRHVPHSQKPQHLVQRRNARERRRVQAVNGAFSRLRKHVPYEPKHKRLSKVKTLRVAIDYIRNLEDMIRDHDATFAVGVRTGCSTALGGHRLYVNVNAATPNVNEGVRSWGDGNTNVYPVQQRRCPQLVHCQPPCQRVDTNYVDFCGEALM